MAVANQPIDVEAPLAPGGDGGAAEGQDGYVQPQVQGAVGERPSPATPPIPGRFPRPSQRGVDSWSLIGFPLGLAATWAGLPPIAQQSIFDKLGLSDTDHMRCMAVDTMTEVFEDLVDLQIQGRAIGFGIKSED